MFKKVTFIVILIIFCYPLAVLAMPCHCFSERDYDPGEPAAADPYYLATSQNSFFSIVFDMEKKNVIFAKQKPRATAEGLWVLNWLASITNRDVQELKREFRTNGNWRNSIEGAGIKKNLLPGGFLELLQSGADDARLSRFIVDHLLIEKSMIAADILQELRGQATSNEETILATLLGLKTGTLATQIHQSVISGETTWGTLLLKAGMNGREMVQEINSLVGTGG